MLWKTKQKKEKKKWEKDGNRQRQVRPRVEAWECSEPRWWSVVISDRLKLNYIGANHLLT